MIGGAGSWLASALQLGRGTRAKLRAWRRRLAIWRRRLLRRGADGVAWVSPTTRIAGSGAPFPHPALAVVFTAETDQEAVRRFLDRQTERSISLTPEAVGQAPCLWFPEGDLAAHPATVLEAALLTLASEPLRLVAFSPWPADDRPITVFRRPLAGPTVGSGVVGRLCSSAPGLSVAGDPRQPPVPFVRSGPYLLEPDAATTAVIELPVTDASALCGSLPAIEDPRGRPSVAFLLPFLAIGGAERLLLELLRDLRATYRCLVITLEPHRPELGETLTLARQLTDLVYTLGDWLPQAALPPALFTLLRRHEVRSLVSWNGTVTFYDTLADLRHRVPGLRIVHQLFDRSDGFLARTTPTLAADIDAHIVANGATASALERRGIATNRVALIHHGVAVPPPPSDAEREARRTRARVALGLPAAKVVVGTFARAHPQKRPFDMLELARRLGPAGYHFLWLGGGPLASALAAEVARAPSANVTLLPMTQTPEPWFDALDICLLPSAYEGLPVFLLEGLARAIPCVATGVGDVPLLLAEGGGYHAPVGDLEALERGLRSLREPAARRHHGELGRRTVLARFTSDRFCADNRRVIFGSASA